MSRNQRRNRRNKSGGSPNANTAARSRTEDRSADVVLHRASTETKSSLKTTELIAYAGAVLAVIMTALAVDDDGRGEGDPFGAESAIRYITYLTIGYLVARGLAKSGSHENRVDRSTDVSDDDAPTRTIDEDARGDDGDDGGDDGDGDDDDTRVMEGDDPAADEAEPARGGTVDARP